MAKRYLRDPEDREFAWRMSRGGMTHEEIAYVLGYPKTTVSNWIASGNRLMRQAMEALREGRENI